MPSPNIILTGRIPSKKNNKKWVYSPRRRRKVLVSSDNFTQWHRDATLQLRSQSIKKHTGKVHTVEINFWMPDNIKADLTNKAESVMDLLVDNGIIKDDAWQYIPCIILNAQGIDKENPRAEIRFYPGENEDGGEK